MIKSYLQYKRFEKFKEKILRDAPKFHARTGVEFNWNVSIISKHRYCTESGQAFRVGCSFIVVEQSPPKSSKDRTVYGYDHKKKEVKIKSLRRWRAL